MKSDASADAPEKTPIFGRTTGLFFWLIGCAVAAAYSGFTWVMVYTDRSFGFAILAINVLTAIASLLLVVYRKSLMGFLLAACGPYALMNAGLFFLMFLQLFGFPSDSRPFDEIPDPPEVKVEMEVLATKSYDPPISIRPDADQSDSNRAWDAIAVDQKMRERCNSWVREVIEYKPGTNLEKWFEFVNDPSHRKRLRRRGGMYCVDDALWMEDYHRHSHKVVLLRYTSSGAPVYSMVFGVPDGSGGKILEPTFHIEDGYLYFDLIRASEAGYTRVVFGTSKVRLKLPAPENALLSSDHETAARLAK